MAKTSTNSERSVPARAWQRMLSGRRLDLLDPSPLDIEIEDIAHGLARLARWNGQTVGASAFSVAQHCILVEQIVAANTTGWRRKWRLAALLHDAPEYVIGDLISPFKAAIGFDYKAFEVRLLAAIHRRFDVPENVPAEVTDAIKAADRIAAYFEATRLAGFSVDEAAEIFGKPRIPAALGHSLQKLEPLTAEQAQRAFLARFVTLTTP